MDEKTWLDVTDFVFSGIRVTNITGEPTKITGENLDLVGAIHPASAKTFRDGVPENLRN